jgi:hypothetical protein
MPNEIAELQHARLGESHGHVRRGEDDFGVCRRIAAETVFEKVSKLLCLSAGLVDCRLGIGRSGRLRLPWSGNWHSGLFG